MQPPTFLLVGIITSSMLVPFLVVAGPEFVERSHSGTKRDVRQKASELASALQFTEGFKYRRMGFEASNPSNSQARPGVMTSQMHQRAIKTNQPNAPTMMKSARKENVRLSLQILALDQWQATAAAESPNQRDFLSSDRELF
mmetsp:Transcript_6013/g.13324  ORF Transcript_6013/g.13324 Transcript_6013/m.13324 type:complete len:142 (-) Transcript_6013:24-449(-)